MPIRIYLACPYTHKNSFVREYRFNAVTAKAVELLKSGYLVYSPITYSHPYDLPKDWMFWRNLDKSLVEWCDEVWVLCLEGWKESIGVQAEIAWAKGLGKRVEYLYAE